MAIGATSDARDTRKQENRLRRPCCRAGHEYAAGEWNGRPPQALAPTYCSFRFVNRNSIVVVFCPRAVLMLLRPVGSQ